MKWTMLLVVLLFFAAPALAQDAGWIGVSVRDRSGQGVLIRAIETSSPAAKAGLKENDVIVEYDKQPVISVLQLTRMVRETPVGRTVEVKVQREAVEQTFQVTAERGPNVFLDSFGGRIVVPDASIIRDRIVRALPGRIDVRIGYSQSGIRVDQLTDQLRTFFGVQENEGVLVTSVEAGSDAEKAGVKAGDVITAVDGEGISSTIEFSREMHGAGNTIALRIIRDKQQRDITIEVSSR